MVDVSVVIPAYKRLQYLNRAIEAVLNQTFDGVYEVIVVISADRDDDLPVVNDDPRLRVLTYVPRLTAAEARNRAIGIARGRDLAFTDSDALAAEDWLEKLREGSKGGSVCVAGSVVNGTPDSICGTAEYILEFLDLHPSRPPRTAWHGVLCNLLVPGEVWATDLPFDEASMAGEDTLLTMSLRSQGRFLFSPEPRVTHFNRTTFRGVMAHQYFLGKSAARIGRNSPHGVRGDPRWLPLVRYSLLAPLATVGRVVSVYARVFAWLKGGRIRSLMMFPLICLLLLTWGWGLFLEGLRIEVRSLREIMARGRPGPT